MIPDRIVIEDQTLRDGIQNETRLLTTEEKLEILEALIDAGVRRFQITSFVHPKKVPQMSDAEKVMKMVQKFEEAKFYALVLNKRGLQRAIQSGCSLVEISVSASNTHSIKNTGMSLNEAIGEMKEMLRAASEHGLKVRAGIQCAFGCRYEGKISEALVLKILEQQVSYNVSEVALADTTGMANPLQVQKLVSEAQDICENRSLFLHLHDTEGKGLANIFAALEAGVQCFDATVAGMGGCPFIPGASGNIAEEDLVLMLHQMGIETGIDLNKLVAVANRLREIFAKDFPGKVSKILNRRDIKCIL